MHKLEQCGNVYPNLIETRAVYHEIKSCFLIDNHYISMSIAFVKTQSLRKTSDVRSAERKGQEVYRYTVRQMHNLLRTVREIEMEFRGAKAPSMRREFLC